MQTTPAASEVNPLEHIGLGGVVGAMLVLVITWFVVRAASGFFEQLGRRFSARRLLLSQISTAARFLIWTFGIVIGVFALNLSRDVVLALMGAAAVTIGLAIKDLASSVLAGITILIDRPFQVGDRVAFGSHYGEISSIGLRSVRLVTLDDNVVTIPNNKFLTDVAASANAGALDMMMQIDFYIGVDQDLTTAKRLVEGCVTSNPYVFTRKPWEVHVAQVIQGPYFAYRLRTQAYVLDVKYEKVYATELTERVHEALQQYRIGPPAALVRSVVPQPSEVIAALSESALFCRPPSRSPHPTKHNRVPNGPTWCQLFFLSVTQPHCPC